MSKLFTALITIALGAIVITALPRGDGIDQKICTDDDGCSVVVAGYGNQITSVDGRIVKINMKLTAGQAALFRGDPYDQLIRVMSTLVKFPGDEPDACSELETAANNVLVAAVSGQVWQETEGDKTPITLCDDLAPESVSATVAGVS